MLELATIKVPEVPDMNKVIRIATLLPEVMEISNLISFTSAAKLTLQVLELAVRYDESRGKTWYLYQYEEYLLY